jgi:hypothetical protein
MGMIIRESFTIRNVAEKSSGGFEVGPSSTSQLILGSQKNCLYRDVAQE